ncbi:hypothetical protein ACLOJK_023914 [Asimina triloba]
MAEVWSLGCVMEEMASDKPVWRCDKNSDANALLYSDRVRRGATGDPFGAVIGREGFLREVFREGSGEAVDRGDAPESSVRHGGGGGSGVGQR